MPSLLSWLALACIPVLALASPVQTEAMSHVEPRGPKYDINELNEEFLGIYWDSAKETCTDEEMEIIIRSTRKAVEMMAFAVDAGGITETAAWNRYFVKESYDKLEDTWSRNFDLWENILNNIVKVRHFPTNGKKNKKGNYTRETKVGYKCTKAQPTKKLCDGRTAGQVTREVGEGDNYAYVLNFCPFFFQQKRHIETWMGEYTKADSMASVNAREATVIHEFMHVNMVGFRKMSSITKQANIDDVVAATPIFPDPWKVYGDSRLHDWAWKDIKGEGKDISGKINTLTAVNADTYAFLFVYHWLHEHLGWQDDGSEAYVKKNYKKTEDLATYGGEGIDENSIHLDKVQSPDNCQKGPDGAPECFFDGSSQQLDGQVGVGNTPEKCDPNDTSGLPAKVFEGMYGDFCEQVTAGGSVAIGLYWLVDNQGRWVMHRRRDSEKRSPPVSANNYPDARAYLTFQKDGDKSCKMSCSEAFDTLIQGSCGRAGGDQSAMAERGHIDAGCGTYSFAAYSGKGDSKPKTPSGLDPDDN